MKVRVKTSGFRFSAALVLLLTGIAVAQDVGDVSLEDGRRFVAVGQLARVRAPDSKQARYVLLDQDGEVTHSLRAAKNVDLKVHIGQEVGVTARTLVDSDTPILLAENVTTFGHARQVSGENINKRIALAAHEEVIIDDGMLGGRSVMSSPIVETHTIDGYPITESPIMDSPVIGSPMMGSQIISDEYYAPAHTCDSGCTSCGSCGQCSTSCASGACGLPGRFWIRSEYLLWWTQGMDTPALVTGSPPGTSGGQAGVLGSASTNTLFGGEPLFSDSRSGARFRIGKWCDSCNWLGFETDYFFLSNEDQNYHDCAIGPDIIARPFFNVQLGRQDAELVQFPGVVNGSVKVDANTSLWSIGPRLRVNLACERFDDICNPRNPCSVGGYRFDMLVGYRYMQLQDSLRIHETLSTVGNDPTFFDLRDSFDTENDFHGADLGFLWEGYRGPWSLEVIGRVGIGSTEQRVTIDGSTTSSNATSSATDQGGLLALESNIGDYKRNEFTVLPEIGVTLGYSLSQRTRFLVGYTFIYWDNVVRAGDHVDLNVNPALLPPVQTTTDAQVPAFAFTETDFWAQGLSLGLEHRW